MLRLPGCRLPPIETRRTPSTPKDKFLGRGFTFQCPAWAACGLHMVLLTKVGLEP